MEKIQTQSDWAARAARALPAAGFGNFDPGMIIREGQGARVWDMDGNEFVDLLIGSGPMLVGHSHPEVMEAVLEALPRGQTFFANNPDGIALAEEIVSAVPCAEQLRYVSTGGEADMYAMRLARAFTGRDKIIKFEGGYHGMSAEAQMSLAPRKRVNFPQAVPDSAGIPDAVVQDMLIAPFNDPAFVTSVLDEFEGQVAAIIVEPLQRIIPPVDGFLQFLRDEATKRGVVLIFDEVVTGFRFAYGGAQELYGVTPDIATLGKVIGGGFPLAAIVGRADIMGHFDKSKVGPEGWLMQMGTLSGNPIASVAGLKTLEILRREGSYETLRTMGERMQDIFTDALEGAGFAPQIVGDPTLFEVVFADQQPRDYRDVQSADASLSKGWNEGLRAGGILKSPGKTYPCLALTEEDFERIASAASLAVSQMVREP